MDLKQIDSFIRVAEMRSFTRAAAAGSIGLPPNLSKLVTVPLTREFRKRLPEAQLTLTEGFSLR